MRKINAELDNKMLSVDDALKSVLSGVKKLNYEEISIAQAANRIIAKDLTSRLTQPPTDVSAMDGYAVRIEDLKIIPTPFNQIGESAAGRSFKGKIQSGQTVRIFTGAPIPDGADTVVIQENTEKLDNKIIVKQNTSSGNYIRKAGQDFKIGQTLIKAGTRLNSRNIALAAAMNIPWLQVIRKPQVAILSTGDELVLPGEEIKPNQIISSNSLGLAVLVESNGGVAINLGIAKDNLKSLKDIVTQITSIDMLVTIGGASVGDYDLVKSALADEGLDITFNRVAMRPGKPLIFGKIHGKPMLGLPGNPVSAGVTASLFLVPAINKMLGLKTPISITENAILGCDIDKNDNRQDYLRAKMSINSSEELIVTPFDRQDSSKLANYANAHCLILREPFSNALSKGEIVRIIRLD